MYDEKITSGENTSDPKDEAGQKEAAPYSAMHPAEEGMEKTEPPGAAAIIHSRTRYRDYREGLLARPADMTKAQAYQWKRQLLRCTGEPEEMRAGHQVRQAVICDGVYGVAGVAAYFRDIATGSFEDEGRRPAYGFVGFAWKNDSLFCPSGFPSMEDFRLLVERYVIPRWEEPKNGKDTEKATLSGYQEQWREKSGTGQVGTGHAGAGQAWTEQAEAEQEDAEALVRQALELAIRGEKVFYCTGLPEQEHMDRVSDAAGEAQEASGFQLNRGLVVAGFICAMAIGILIWKILYI